MQPPQNTSSNSNNKHIPGLERPATTFLSYARQDAGEVKYLQQQLNVRGVRAWRDVTDLPLGGANEGEIIHAIEQVADAFVIYITPTNPRFAFHLEY
jgi:TIR domain